MDRSEVYAAVCAAIREEVDRPLPDLKPEDTFDSLGVDSLDLICVCWSLEQKFDIDVDTKQIKTEVGADGTKKPLNEMTVSQFVDQVMEMTSARDQDSS